MFLREGLLKVAVLIGKNLIFSPSKTQVLSLFLFSADIICSNKEIILKGRANKLQKNKMGVHVNNKSTLLGLFPFLIPVLYFLHYTELLTELLKDHVRSHVFSSL